MKKKKRKSKNKGITYQEYPGSPSIEISKDYCVITNKGIRIKLSHEEWKKLYKLFSSENWEEIWRREKLILRYITNPDYLRMEIPRLSPELPPFGPPYVVTTIAIDRDRLGDNATLLDHINNSNHPGLVKFLASFVIPAIENSPERLSDPKLWTGPHGTELNPFKKGQHDNQLFVDDMKVAAGLLYALFSFLSADSSKGSQDLLKLLIVPEKFPKDIRVQTKAGKLIPISCAACCLDLVFSQHVIKCDIAPFSSNLKSFRNTYINDGRTSLNNPDHRVLDLVDSLIRTQSYREPHIPDKLPKGKRLVDVVWELTILALIEDLARVYLNVHSPLYRSPRKKLPMLYPQMSQHSHSIPAYKAILYKAVKSSFSPVGSSTERTAAHEKGARKMGRMSGAWAVGTIHRRLLRTL